MKTQIGFAVQFEREMFGGTGVAAIRANLNCNQNGRGRNAKRRAAQIVRSMVMSGRFGPDFDRLNRYSC